MLGQQPVVSHIILGSGKIRYFGKIWFQGFLRIIDLTFHSCSYIRRLNVSDDNDESGRSDSSGSLPYH